MIEWKPIAEIPDGLKDGREVLLGQWDRNVGGTANPQPDRWSSVVAVWMSYGNGVRACWQLAEAGTYAEDGDLSGEPTYFAEINPPLTAVTTPLP